MDMDKREILCQAEAFAKEILEKDSSGHDWWHIYRVAQSAKTIATQEGANAFICEMAALLHDIADEKLTGNEQLGLKKVSDWMSRHGVAASDAAHVMEIISTMSFKGGGMTPMRTLEGKIVQDADRLDAIGAVGIARVFAYSGAKNRLIHDPMLKPREEMTRAEYRKGDGTGINHFYEKLLKLKDLMNTDFAKKMAEERHRFMENYLHQFYQEWDGKA